MITDGEGWVETPLGGALLQLAGRVAGAALDGASLAQECLRDRHVGRKSQVGCGSAGLRLHDGRPEAPLGSPWSRSRPARLPVSNVSIRHALSAKVEISPTGPAAIRHGVVRVLRPNGQNVNLGDQTDGPVRPEAAHAGKQASPRSERRPPEVGIAGSGTGSSCWTCVSRAGSADASADPPAAAAPQGEPVASKWELRAARPSSRTLAACGPYAHGAHAGRARRHRCGSPGGANPSLPAWPPPAIDPSLPQGDRHRIGLSKAIPPFLHGDWGAERGGTRGRAASPGAVLTGGRHRKP